MNKVIKLLLFTLLLFILVACNAKEVELEKPSILESAQSYALDLKYDLALEQYQALIQAEPNNYLGYLGAYEMFVELSDFENAVIVIEQGLLENPSNEELLKIYNSIQDQDSDIDEISDDKKDDEENGIEKQLNQKSYTSKEGGSCVDDLNENDIVIKSYCEYKITEETTYFDIYGNMIEYLQYYKNDGKSVHSFYIYDYSISNKFPLYSEGTFFGEYWHVDNHFNGSDVPDYTEEIIEEGTVLRMYYRDAYDHSFYRVDLYYIDGSYWVYYNGDDGFFDTGTYYGSDGTILDTFKRN